MQQKWATFDGEEEAREELRALEGEYELQELVPVHMHQTGTVRVIRIVRGTGELGSS